MNDQLTDHSFNLEDDISILPGEDDVNSMSPHVVPFFNLTASRHHQLSSSGITSMEALRNAYEELKKKYNDLNMKYTRLNSSVQKNNRAEFIPDEFTSGSHSLDEKSKMIQMSRKDEIEKLHNAILRLNHELSEEKSKNIKLQVQINSFKEMPQPTTSAEGPSDKSIHILEDLRNNVEMLERSVEFHKAVITKQLPQSQRVNQILFGKSDCISQRKQQSEHDELSSLGNNPGHSRTKLISAAGVTTIPMELPHNAAWQSHKTDNTKPSSIVDLKSTRQKQEKLHEKIDTTLPSSKHLITNTPSSSTTPQPSSTITKIETNGPVVREKDLRDIPYFGDAEAFLPMNGSDSSLCVSEMLCPICEKPFTDLQKFQEHVFDCKSDSADRSCPVCLKNFKNAPQQDFEEHVHTHFEEPDDFDVLNF